MTETTCETTDNFHPAYQPPVVEVTTGENPNAGSPRARRLRRIADERKGWVFTPSHVPVVRVGPRVGRNKPCACGSGRKRKHCHAD